MNSLKRNFTYQIAYQVLNLILPLISAPYIARVLGADNSGIYSYTNVIANYFVVFGMLGIEQYGNRCIARVRDRHSEMNIVFSELFLLHIIMSVFIIAFYFIYVLFVNDNYTEIFLIQGMYVISILFDVNWFFFGIEKFKITVIRNSIVKIISFASIFIFVKNNTDLPIYTCIMSLSILVSQIIILPQIKKYVSLKRVTLKGMIKHILPMIILFIAVIAANMNRMIDKVMLGWFNNMHDLGCYDYADRIIRIPLSLIAAFGTIMLSKMSNLFANKNNKQINSVLDISSSLILVLSIGMGFGVAAIAPEFINWYLGASYRGTDNLLFILSLSIPLVGWNNFIRTQILIPMQLDIVYTKAVSIGAICNILINLFLINLFGAYGASIATVISYLIISIIQTKSLIKSTQILKYLNSAKILTIGGILMFILIRVIALCFTNDFVSLTIEIIVGFLFYSVFAFIYLKIKKPYIIKKILK